MARKHGRTPLKWYTMDLHIHTPASSDYQQNGVEYIDSGSYSENFKNANGCDSTATLILTINKTTESIEEVAECNSYTWNCSIFDNSNKTFSFITV